MVGVVVLGKGAGLNAPQTGKLWKSFLTNWWGRVMSHTFMLSSLHSLQFCILPFKSQILVVFFCCLFILTSLVTVWTFYELTAGD